MGLFRRLGNVLQDEWLCEETRVKRIKENVTFDDFSNWICEVYKRTRCKKFYLEWGSDVNPNNYTNNNYRENSCDNSTSPSYQYNQNRGDRNSQRNYDDSDIHVTDVYHDNNWQYQHNNVIQAVNSVSTGRWIPMSQVYLSCENVPQRGSKKTIKRRMQRKAQKRRMLSQSSNEGYRYQPYLVSSFLDKAI